MGVLSLDLGTKNFAWSYLSELENRFFVDFDLMCLDKKNSRSVYDNRIESLKEFFEMITKKYVIEVVVIEKQVKMNYACCNLVYAIITICKFLGLPYFQFSPLWKFTSIQQEYTCKKKAHKGLSIRNCIKFLEMYCEDGLEKFKKYKKRDDIADSINQGIVYCLLKNFWNLIKLEDYKKLITFKYEYEWEETKWEETKWEDLKLD
jgi:hypothetical protein